MEVNLKDIKLSPDLDSVVRIPMSDEEYFGPKYSDYTSNSRLKLINPEKGGSPSKYKTGFTGSEDYLQLGRKNYLMICIIHELLLSL